MKEKHCEKCGHVIVNKTCDQCGKAFDGMNVPYAASLTFGYGSSHDFEKKEFCSDRCLREWACDNIPYSFPDKPASKRNADLRDASLANQVTDKEMDEMARVAKKAIDEKIMPKINCPHPSFKIIVHRDGEYTNQNEYKLCCAQCNEEMPFFFEEDDIGVTVPIHGPDESVSLIMGKISKEDMKILDMMKKRDAKKKSTRQKETKVGK